MSAPEVDNRIGSSRPEAGVSWIFQGDDCARAQRFRDAQEATFVLATEQRTRVANAEQTAALRFAANRERFLDMATKFSSASEAYRNARTDFRLRRRGRFRIEPRPAKRELQSWPPSHGRDEHDSRW